MSIIGWIVLGILAGFLASKVVNGSGGGLVVDMILGVIGAFVGGFALNFLGKSGVTGFNVWSLFVAFVGAVVILVTYHAVTGRRVRA